MHDYRLTLNVMTIARPAREQGPESLADVVSAIATDGADIVNQSTRAHGPMVASLMVRFLAEDHDTAVDLVNDALRGLREPHDSVTFAVMTSSGWSPMPLSTPASLRG